MAADGVYRELWAVQNEADDWSIQKLTFRKPWQLTRPVAWTFLEDFFSMFSAIIIYIAINMLAFAFRDPGVIQIRSLALTSALLAGLTLAQYAIGRGTYHNTHVISADWLAEDRIDYVMKLRHLPLGFFSRKERGELINNFLGDFIHIHQALIGFLAGLFSIVAAILLTSVGMFLFNRVMAGAFYLAMPVAALLLFLSATMLERHSQRIALARDKAATHLSEYLLGMKTLKSHNQTGEGFGKLKQAYRDLMDSSIKAESGPGSLTRLCTSIVQFGLPLMCLAGSYLLIGGSMGVVELISIIIIGTKILGPVITAVNNLGMLRMNYVSAKRLDATMQEKKMGGDIKPSGDPEISFQNVNFAYTAGADQILVMEGGEVKERGTHGELMSLKGLYARVWGLQRQATGWNLNR